MTDPVGVGRDGGELIALGCVDERDHVDDHPGCLGVEGGDLEGHVAAGVGAVGEDHEVARSVAVEQADTRDDAVVDARALAEGHLGQGLAHVVVDHRGRDRGGHGARKCDQADRDVLGGTVEEGVDGRRRCVELPLALHAVAGVEHDHRGAFDVALVDQLRVHLDGTAVELDVEVRRVDGGARRQPVGGDEEAHRAAVGLDVVDPDLVGCPRRGRGRQGHRDPGDRECGAPRPQPHRFPPTTKTAGLRCTPWSASRSRNRGRRPVDCRLPLNLPWSSMPAE